MEVACQAPGSHTDPPCPVLQKHSLSDTHQVRVLLLTVDIEHSVGVDSHQDAAHVGVDQIAVIPGEEGIVCNMAQLLSFIFDQPESEVPQERGLVKI